MFINHLMHEELANNEQRATNVVGCNAHSKSGHMVHFNAKKKQTHTNRSVKAKIKSEYEKMGKCRKKDKQVSSTLDHIAYINVENVLLRCTKCLCIFEKKKYNIILVVQQIMV